MSDFTPDPDFDERARAAGRELRQPPPPGGLRQLERTRRNRRFAQAGGAVAVVAIAAGGIFAVTRGDDDGTITTADSTIVTTPVSAPVTVPGTTAPAVVPSSPTTNASTSEPGSASPTTVPAESPGAPTVWIGGKLGGYYTDAGFVAATSPTELPAGVLGSTIEVTGLAGSTVRATVTDEQCTDAYLSPPPAAWDVLATADAALIGAAAESGDSPAELVRDLTELGIEITQVRSFAIPPIGDGTAGSLVLVDGRSEQFEFPSWIATWDAGTGEFTTVEGDPDPSMALDIGNPVEAFYDFDADGRWEIAYGVGDAWVVQELATSETIVAGDAHPCPAEWPELTVEQSLQALSGEWALEPGGDTMMWVTGDPRQNDLVMGTCSAVVAPDRLGLSAWPGTSADCGPAHNTPERRVITATLDEDFAFRIDQYTGELRIALDDGSEARLFKVYPPLDTVDLGRGTAFGVYTGSYARVDDMIGTISAALGDPTADTGWYTTPPNPNPDSPDCLADMDTRDVGWGDFSASFWPDPENAEMGTLWKWSLDGEAPDATPTGLVTVEGFAIGTWVFEVEAWFGDGVNWTEPSDGRALGSVLNSARQLGGYRTDLLFRSTDDRITNVDVRKSFC